MTGISSEGEPLTSVAALADRLWALPDHGEPRLVALAGPPACGKSTLATLLATRMSKPGHEVAVVPLDGFHLDNTVLSRHGCLDRKGAPETFDSAGFIHSVRRLAQGERVIFPDFDRSADRAIAGRIEVTERHRMIIFEGNYLCTDRAPWSDLLPLWTCSISVEVSDDVLRRRLIARWLKHGLDEATAIARAETNDLANAAFVRDTMGAVDVVFRPPAHSAHEE